ncbi:hypothetical protein PUR71_09510 [Streptomyces sp. SP17BM10]|uniref:hypothetical protein n=1 Tax=Streptomyces sp. SP17BM10 TaxID=3002530 RepID=UPI002E77F1ED|nr:hypothetical protein [Streptomyces sp. SP17BM10]MEE1783150.1 hypothetical protein [Streptomyces sp. SP17BM10]
MELEAIFEAIDAVDWEAHPHRRDPENAATAVNLRALAGAATLNQAADAMTRLLESAITDDFEGTVNPAAALAAPILLDVVEHGHRRAASAALDLLRTLLNRFPDPDFGRTGGPRLPGLKVCCVLADLVRARQDVVLLHRDQGRWLMALAADHWRFEIHEVVDETADGVGVFGVLTGRPPARPVRAELHFERGFLGILAVEMEHGPEDDSGESFLRLVGIPAAFVAPGAVVAPWDCHDFDH